MHGYQIVARFSDEGVSAYRRRASQRPGMQEMVDYVLKNECEAVFFYDESRITRQVTDFVLEVWEEIGLRKPDVKFFSHLRTTTRMGSRRIANATSACTGKRRICR